MTVAKHRGGTLTLLFTDLVDSTAVGNRLGGDAGQALRRAHDRLLRREFEDHKGTVVKGTGDGFFVTFASARDAVACACAIQREIATQQAEGRYGELSVRIGLNTGEPVEEEGDVFGSDVTLAARLMAEAQGGEVLISQVTCLLIRQHGFAVEPAGERTLKGYAQPVPSFRVLWQDTQTSQRRQSRFVGRVAEQARLRSHIDALLQGRGGLVLIAGEAGIGKTRLTTEIALQAQDRGARAVTGRAFETEGLPPYYAVAGPIGHHLRTRTQQDLDRLVGADGRYIVRMLPELQTALTVGEAPSLSPEAERHLLFEAFTNLLLRLAADAPLLVVLDDLQWADHASVHLLQHIVQRTLGTPLLIVATYREVELDDAHPLRDLVNEIARRGPGECLTLQPLSREDSAVLVEDVLGQVPAASVLDDLYTTAEGNPFFTEELVRSLSSAPPSVPPSTSAVTGTVPEGVRHVMLQRLSLLSDDANHVLIHCAVLGHDLTLQRVAAVAARPEEELIDLVEEALDARVLRETGEGFSFGHPLVRETIYQGISVPRRRLLHRQAAQALEAHYAGSAGAHAPELAHHYLEAATDDAGVTKALDYARTAATQAMDVFAYEDAVVFYQQALTMLDRIQSTDRLPRCDLLLSLADAQAKAGEGTLAERAIREAATIAREYQYAEQLALAAIRYHDVRGSSGIVDQFFIQLVQDACRALPADARPLRARLLAVRPTALYHVEPHDRLAELSEDAVAMARRLGDPATLVWVLGATHAYRCHPDDLAGQLESANELLRLAELHGIRETALRARRFKIDVLLRLGEIAKFDQELEILEQGANDIRLPIYLWRVAVCRAMRALLAGRLEEAERLAQHAYSIGQEVPGDSGLAFQFLAIQLFAIRREQGKLGELQPVVQSFINQYPALRWRVGLAYVLCDVGHLDEARSEFERMASGGFAELPLDFNWLISATILAEVCAWLKDAGRASALYDLLVPHATQTAVIGDTVACNGSVARYLALLAATMGQWDKAERHFRDALEMNERMGARPFVAHTAQEFAEMLLERSAPGDSARAKELLDRALDEARALGLVRVEERAQALRQHMSEDAP